MNADIFRSNCHGEAFCLFAVCVFQFPVCLHYISPSSAELLGKL